MKKIVINLYNARYLLLFILVSSSTSLLAQIPESISYQAIISDNQNQIIANSEVGIRLSILAGSPTGEELYYEERVVSTNESGLVTLHFGGDHLSAYVNWAEPQLYIRIDVDPEGGANYQITSVNQLLSVPYAFRAQTAENVDDDDADPENELQTLSYSNNQLTISDGNTVTIQSSMNDSTLTQNYWSTSGNSDLDPEEGAMIGTTDSVAVSFITNGEKRMEITPNGGLYFFNPKLNTFMGFWAGLNADSTSTRNIYIGHYAGTNNISGENNIGIGVQALFANNEGIGNTAIGNLALGYHREGNYNTAMGTGALGFGDTGEGNTAVGAGALGQNADGSYNTSMGYLALQSNIGDNNTAIGNEALRKNTDGESNTIIGALSGIGNTTGSRNSTLGISSMASNKTGNDNVAIGYAALFNNTDRSNIVAIGDHALFNNGMNSTSETDATANTAVGSKALYNNTTGFANTALGSNTLEINEIGIQNVAIGDSALYYNGNGATNTTSSSKNVAIGSRTMVNNTVGRSNTAVGQSALWANTTGNMNTATGNRSMLRNTGGHYNVAMGERSLQYNQTGDYNVAVGYNAGPSSSYNDLRNTISLGYSAQATADNSVRIGNANINQIGGAVAWSNLSDGRFKTNVQENVPGLDFILRLRPVTYNWNLHKLNQFQGNEVDDTNMSKSQKIYTGFIAQEVEQAAQNSSYDFSGVIQPANQQSLYNLSYAEFVVPLVKAVQEQNQVIDELQKSNQQLTETLESLQREITQIKNSIKN